MALKAGLSSIPSVKDVSELPPASSVLGKVFLVRSIGRLALSDGSSYSYARPDDQGQESRAATVAALTGSLTGTVTGAMADVTALSTTDTYTDAAVNAKITLVNLQLKTLQATVNAILSSLKAAKVMS